MIRIGWSSRRSFPLNEDILSEGSFKELICLNDVKHRNPHISKDMAEFELLRGACYQFKAPVVVFSSHMYEDGPGTSSGSQIGSRGREGGELPTLASSGVREPKDPLVSKS